MNYLFYDFVWRTIAFFRRFYAEDLLPIDANDSQHTTSTRRVTLVRIEGTLTDSKTAIKPYLPVCVCIEFNSSSCGSRGKYVSTSFVVAFALVLSIQRIIQR